MPTPSLLIALGLLAILLGPLVLRLARFVGCLLAAAVALLFKLMRVLVFFAGAMAVMLLLGL